MLYQVSDTPLTLGAVRGLVQDLATLAPLIVGGIRDLSLPFVSQKWFEENGIGTENLVHYSR